MFTDIPVPQGGKEDGAGGFTNSMYSLPSNKRVGSSSMNIPSTMIYQKVRDGNIGDQNRRPGKRRLDVGRALISQTSKR